MKTILTALAAMLFISSCKKISGEGPVVTQQRPVAGYSKLAVDVSAKVFYAIDTVYQLEVQAQQNILDVLQTNIIGNELAIKVKDGYRIGSNAGVIVKITAPSPEAIQLSGSGECILTGSLTRANLQLRVSGSGDITIPSVNITGTLTAAISGSGSIRIQAGAVKNEDLRISGSGKMEMANVVAEKAVTDISGSGDMRLHVTQNLNASISGSGSVYYFGMPQVSTHISGSGKVVRL
jgi:Putative auto-transporter adhesin, head GIN domain